MQANGRHKVGIFSLGSNSAKKEKKGKESMQSLWNYDVFCIYYAYLIIKIFGAKSFWKVVSLYLFMEYSFNTFCNEDF